VSGRYEMRAREGLADAEPLRCAVGKLASDQLVICDPATAVREVAERMAAVDSSIALVDLGGDYGVITDHDLRTRVVATGAGGDTPARAGMTSPARVVTADRPGSEVLVEMVENGLNHLPVMDARGSVLGVVTSADLIATSMRQPFQLRSQIL